MGSAVRLLHWNPGWKIRNMGALKSNGTDLCVCGRTAPGWWVSATSSWSSSCRDVSCPELVSAPRCNNIKHAHNWNIQCSKIHLYDWKKRNSTSETHQVSHSVLFLYLWSIIVALILEQLVNCWTLTLLWGPRRPLEHWTPCWRWRRSHLETGEHLTSALADWDDQ